MTATVHAWCSLDPAVSLLVIEPGAGAPTLVGADGETMRSAYFAAPASAMGLVVVRSDGDAHLCEGVRLIDGGAQHVWDAELLADCHVEPDELLVDHLVAADDPTRAQIVAFLVESVMVGASDRDATALVLHQFREALRTRSERSVVADGGRPAAAIETLVLVDEHTAYLRGWIAWPADRVLRLTAVSPEGERVELADDISRHRRADVDRFYGRAPSAASEPGFAALVTTVGESRLAAGWFVELETADGRIEEIEPPPATSDPTMARDVLLAELELDRRGGELWERQLSPALERLGERKVREVWIDEVVEHGRADDATVTVIVPLYRRVDLMEYQLAQFSLDPSMRDVDVVYVLDSPEQADELRSAAGRWSRLYGQPFRLALLSANGGFSLANNLGADLATGRDLVLCNSDVLPEGPGWLGRLLASRQRAAEAVGGLDGIGAVGPMLLYEDDSLQHAGMYFHRSSPVEPWSNEHYFKGMHRSFAPAHRPRQVPAVTAACLLVDAARYRSIGGLSTSYVQGDYEDSDLCLRLAQDGGRSWYAADVRLYHLEGGSYPGADRSRFGRYNRWLHQRRWGRAIESLMASGEFDPSRVIESVEAGA